MDLFPPLARAAVTGFTSGLLLAIPVGPVNLTIINEGARRGFMWALLIGMGATLMEIIYCSIAFTGFASLFDNHVVKASMELFSFGFMLFLGIKFITAKTAGVGANLGHGTTFIQQRIDARLHPHSAFMTGFVRVMGNPGVLLGWIVLSAVFVSHDWVHPDLPGKLTCVSGVAVATGLWFFFLSYGASRGRGRFSEHALLRLEHISGVVLLALAFGHGSYLVWQMAKHKI